VRREPGREKWLRISPLDFSTHAWVVMNGSENKYTLFRPIEPSP
jgi:hypothetical protein